VSSLLLLCKHYEQFLLLIGHGQYFSMLCYLLDWLIITRLVLSLLPLHKHQEQFLLLISRGQYFSVLWLDWLINTRLASGLLLFTSENNFTALLCPDCVVNIFYQTGS